ALAVVAVLVVPDPLARLGVQAVQLGQVVGDVQPALVQDRRGELGLDAVHLPDPLRLALVQLAGVQADDAPLAVVLVLLAVADVDQAARNHRRAVDRGRPEDVAPDLLAGAHLEGVHAAVAAAGDPQPLAVDDRHHRAGVVGVLGLQAGAGPPDHVAGLLVEGHEARPPGGVLAPAGVEHADDDQVAVHNRAGDPAAVAGDPAVL